MARARYSVHGTRIPSGGVGPLDTGETAAPSRPICSCEVAPCPLHDAAAAPLSTPKEEPAPKERCGRCFYVLSHHPSCPEPEIASLRAALSEARKDTERLDWLNGRVSWFTQHFAYAHKYANVRESIDAARTPTEDTKDG